MFLPFFSIFGGENNNPTFMQDALQNISIQKILRLSGNIDSYSIGSDFILGEAEGGYALANNRILEILKYPIRFDGYIIFFLKKGHFKIEVNLGSYEVQEMSLLVSVPGNIIRIDSPSDEGIADTRLVFAVLSKEFMSGLRLDFNKVFQDSLQLLENPCIVLDDEQLSLAESYFLLAKQVLVSSLSNKKQIIEELLSSLSYLAENIWKRQIQSRTKDAVLTDAGARAQLTFERFIKLVTEFHGSQRGMQFYADKLCLTPKYLSKVIRDTSGRSGPDWIDAFVILEAKNLLRYSGESIKEIVFKLNFPSVSVFNKFFKTRTGMSPSEYRRGV